MKNASSFIEIWVFIQFKKEGMTFQGAVENFFHEYTIIHKQKPPAFHKAWIYERSKMLDYSKFKSSLVQLSQNYGAFDE